MHGQLKTLSIKGVFTALLITTLFAVSGLASRPVKADDLPLANPFMRYSNPHSAVLAVQTLFDVDNGTVHIAVYDKHERFLKSPVKRLQAPLDETGLAIFPLEDLNQKDYAFVAFLDENTDGRLNRNFLGKPKEPFIFSNNIRPNLRKPTFEETKVKLFPGRVIVISIQD